MGIEEKINGEIKNAMLAKNAGRLDALRAVKSALLLLKTSTEGLTEENANKAMMKEVKKRKETALIYAQQNRADLAEVENYQALVIEEFLPKGLSVEEVETELKKIIEQMGAKTLADLGKVMGAANKGMAGKADGKMISDLVKKLLA